LYLSALAFGSCDDASRNVTRKQCTVERRGLDRPGGPMIILAMVYPRHDLAHLVGPVQAWCSSRLRGAIRVASSRAVRSGLPASACRRDHGFAEAWNDPTVLFVGGFRRKADASTCCRYPEAIAFLADRGARGPLGSCSV
jgi:hypothetical protein